MWELPETNTPIKDLKECRNILRNCRIIVDKFYIYYLIIFILWLISFSSSFFLEFEIFFMLNYVYIIVLINCFDWSMLIFYYPQLCFFLSLLVEKKCISYSNFQILNNPFTRQIIKIYIHVTKCQQEFYLSSSRFQFLISYFSLRWEAIIRV